MGSNHNIFVGIGLFKQYYKIQSEWDNSHHRHVIHSTFSYTAKPSRFHSVINAPPFRNPCRNKVSKYLKKEEDGWWWRGTWWLLGKKIKRRGLKMHLYGLTTPKFSRKGRPPCPCTIYNPELILQLPVIFSGVCIM